MNQKTVTTFVLAILAAAWCGAALRGQQPAPTVPPLPVIVTPLPAGPQGANAPRSVPTNPYDNPLLTGLKNGDPGLRVKALYNIVHSGPGVSAAVPDMLKILQNEQDLSVRRAYLWALRQIDPAAAASLGQLPPYLQR